MPAVHVVAVAAMSLSLVVPSSAAPASERPATPQSRALADGAPSPRFTVSVSGPLTRADVPYSWRPGCPVAPAQLRTMTMTYWGFDGQVHTGRLVVSAGSVAAMRAGFGAAFAARFEIRRMVPVDAYYRSGTASPATSDTLSMNADNTSAFNCRPKTGRTSFSEHSWGAAVDINPYENPSRAGSTIYPAKAASAYYWNRSRHLTDRGVITPTGALYRALVRAGWHWGGRWSPGHDYQHFSRSGS